MAKRPNRRQFLKTGLASGLSLAFAPLLEAAPRPAAARLPVNERVLQAATQQPFTALPSSLPLGQPLADISMGWDGSVWGIDTNGVPHQYDTVAQSWQVYGSGFDAVGLLPDGSTVVSLGAEISIAGAAPTAIASFWNDLPDSFAAGLDGFATAQNGTIQTTFLFRNGRFLTIDPATAAPYQAPVDLPGWFVGWPTTSAAWQNGAITAVGSNPNDITDPRVTLWTQDEYIVVTMQNATVIDGPNPISALVGDELAAIMATGFDAVLVDLDNVATTLQVFKGPVVWSAAGNPNAPVPGYVNSYAPTIAPLLAAAPSGVIGALWAATTGQQATLNDGDTWQAAPDPASDVLSLAAGQDGTVVAITVPTSNSTALVQLSSDGTTWNPLATSPSNAVQVSVGDADHVWVRDSSNGVSRVSGGSSSAVDLGQPATHIAANADGTLWQAGGDGNAYRFISEGTAPSTALSLGSTGTVTNVASTGFGTAVVLAAADTGTGAAAGAAAGPQMYGYDSLYAWKTSTSYYSAFDYAQFPYVIATAGHSVFVLTFDQTNAPDNGIVVALDAQSGAELWPTPWTVPFDLLQGGTLIYDAALDLVYVASGSMLYALDAAGGTEVWSLALGANGQTYYDVLGTPTLATGLLSVGRADGAVALLDTTAALAAAQANEPVPLLWTSAQIIDPNTGNDPPLAIGAPALDPTGVVYLQAQLASGTSTYQPTVVALDGGSGATLWSRSLPEVNDSLGNVSPCDIIYGSITVGGVVVVPALFVNARTAVYALDPADGTTMYTYALPGSSNDITSSLAYRAGQLYFGDFGGTLRVLDATTLQPVTSAPPIGTPVTGAPALIDDAGTENGTVVMYTCGAQNVQLFDPTSGNAEAIATDLTAPGSLAYDPTHGLLYAMGSNSGSSTGLIGQVFAMRPDAAIQAERAFIVESQLMQDYATDAEAATYVSATAPGGVARYQTHVTIVDANNVGLANTSIKLWSDDDGTAVLIDTQAFTIGPDTPALFTTDGTGSFTITSDATDLQTSTLQLWAAFMDASERITITPDTEFHTRLASTTATGSTDPLQVDTVSATAYDGTPLFASSQQSQAQDAATAITQLTAAVGIGASTSTSLSTTAQRGAAPKPSPTPTARSDGNVTSTQATTPKYGGAGTFPGMRYSAVSTAYTPGVTVGAPLGFSLTSSGLTALTPATAANQIDALQGTAPAGALLAAARADALLGGLIGDLKSAWDDIKKTGAKVVKVVVSVANKVYVCIQYVVNGVTQVVKQVVADVQDAMAVIGSLIIQLGKVLLNAVEALSLLLHLDQIFKTAAIIRSFFENMTGRLSTDLGNAFKTLYTDLETMATNAETTFGNLIATLEGGSATGATASSWGQLTGGTTATSVLTVAPTDGSAPPTSVAVHGMWGMHTVRKNKTGISQPQSVSAQQSDPLSAALAGFLGDGSTLAASLTPILSQFGSGIKIKSPSDILDLAIADVLTLAEAAIVAGIEIMRDLVTALSDVVSDIAASFSDGGPLTVPVLSKLWSLAGLPTLTALDLITFVVAIPVTLVYYVLAGHWLSDDLPSVGASAGAAALEGANLMVLARAFGLIGAMVSLAAGLFSAVNDTLYVTSAGETSMIEAVWAPILNFVLLVLLCAGPIYDGSTNTTNPEYWITVGLTVIANLITAFSSKIGTPAQAAEAGPIWTMISWLFAIGVLVAQYEGDTNTNQAELVIVADALNNMPGVIGVVKLIADPEAIIPYAAPVADLGCMWAAAGITLDVTIKNWNTQPSPPPSPTPSPDTIPFRFHLPRIENNP